MSTADADLLVKWQVLYLPALFPDRLSLMSHLANLAISSNISQSGKAIKTERVEAPWAPEVPLTLLVDFRQTFKFVSSIFHFARSCQAVPDFAGYHNVAVTPARRLDCYDVFWSRKIDFCNFWPVFQPKSLTFARIGPFSGRMELNVAIIGAFSSRKQLSLD